MKPILEIQNISKKFRIQHEQHPYLSLRDSLVSMFKPSTRTSEEFYALKDISFDVFPGESIGIIGKNGAGKSTLLKILSKITPPTDGKIISRGRIASLLEVGTGFHPELSGRENIFLNGSILGMKRKEILAKFDEIVDFSGVEQFLDTPLKHYSSGMQLRLAFAVAAFLEPEILIIDEVLAVGDAEFQKKCMGKMKDVSSQGRTVLFVSHNMAAVQNLCSNGIVLNHGGITCVGKIEDCVNKYFSSIHINNQYSLRDRTDRQGNGKIRIVDIFITSKEGDRIDTVYSGQDIKIIIEYETLKGVSEELLQDVIISIQVKNSQGIPVFLHHNRIIKKRFDIISNKGLFIAEINKIPLPPSSYNITFCLSNFTGVLDSIESAVQFNIIEGDFFGFGEIPPASHGLQLIEVNWDHL